MLQAPSKERISIANIVFAAIPAKDRANKVRTDLRCSYLHAHCPPAAKSHQIPAALIFRKPIPECRTKYA